MSEWLDIMMSEIGRKKREAEEAREELERRRQGDADSKGDDEEVDQS